MIGREGALPWRLKSDMQRFSDHGQAGADGAQDLGRVCRSGRCRGACEFGADARCEFRRGGNARVYTDAAVLVAAGRAMAEAAGVDEVCVIGGAQLYEALAPEAERIVLMEVN